MVSVTTTYAPATDTASLDDAEGWRFGSSQESALPPPAINLDTYQLALVDHVSAAGHGPVLLLAGPGTGKTTTVIEAVTARVAAGTDPSRILTLTFSRKAAGELRARLGVRLGRTVAAPLAWTFHGFGYSLLVGSSFDSQPPRLISGPEQEVAVRELLTHDPSVGRVRWPLKLHAALSTRGFTDEVRTLLARARALGMSPDDLRDVSAGRPDWIAAADFMAEYLDVLDSRGVVDYAELVARAAAYAESEKGRLSLRSGYDLVVVDEYQDTDPAQERLLQAIAGGGRDLLVVGDPDQSIYGFRGADVGGLLEFPARFRQSNGSVARTFVLRVSRRLSPQLLTASRRIATEVGGAGTPLVSHLRQHRDLLADAGHATGQIDVQIHPSAQDEAAAIADMLRREHLFNQVAWSDMAVLVRSATVAIPLLRRSLIYAGVPVEVAGDDVPLSQEPALTPLLTAMQVVADPTSLTSDVARELLLSPLGNVDAGNLRQIGRGLRDHDNSGHGNPTGPESSGELLRQALLDPTRFATLNNRIGHSATGLATSLLEAREIASNGGSAHDVLWHLWIASSWARRLEAASQGGGAAARTANRDLDAIVALFDVAARTDDRLTAPGVTSFLAELQAQQIPGDTLAEKGARPSGVRLLTAHRSKGLEWQVVVVAGVQADDWPDLRRRGSLLEPDRLGPSGVRPPLSIAEVKRDERRLFYVAITRAKRRLLVTAVQSAADDGPQPSPFVSELGVSVNARLQPAKRPLTVDALTAELRAVVTDPRHDTHRRRAAAQRLAVLAQAEFDGRPLVHAAHPDRWWGTRPTSASKQPLRMPDEPLRLSGSQLEKIAACPLQWFLSREANGEQSHGTAAGFGKVVHALCDGVAKGSVAPDLDSLVAHLDTVWSQLQFAAAWESAAERREAAAALQRFLGWCDDNRGRTLAGSEQPFETTIAMNGRQILLRGRLDRIEIDDNGRVVVVDFKTGRRAGQSKRIANDIQLATYQRAVADAVLPEISGPPGGAELVYLRHTGSGGKSELKVQHQPAFPAGQDLFTLALQRAVELVSTEDIRATPGDVCKHCAFKRACPAQPEGRELIT